MGVFKAGVIVDGRFELVRQLGRGSTAVVWLARDRTAGGDVAVKLMHQHMLHRKNVAEQVQREISALEAMDHDGIARPVAFSLLDQTAYLAMELVDGMSLDRWLGTRVEPIPSQEILSLMDQLTAAVEHAHRKFVVHRDLKPHNVALVSPDRPRPKVKVLDFGVARLLDGGLFDATTLGRRIGSLFYMSPEQYRGERADERADIFALGAILFELLTLHRAWPRGPEGEYVPAFSEPIPRTPLNAVTAVAERIAYEPRPRPTAVIPRLPEICDLIIEKAMAIEPEARHQTVAELRGELLPVLQALKDPEATRIAFGGSVPTAGGLGASRTEPVERAVTATMEPLAGFVEPEVDADTQTVTRPVPPPSLNPKRMSRRQVWTLIALAVGTAAVVLLVGALALSR